MSLPMPKRPRITSHPSSGGARRSCLTVSVRRFVVLAGSAVRTATSGVETQRAARNADTNSSIDRIMLRAPFIPDCGDRVAALALGMCEPPTRSDFGDDIGRKRRSVGTSVNRGLVVTPSGAPASRSCPPVRSVERRSGADPNCSCMRCRSHVCCGASVKSEMEIPGNAPIAEVLCTGANF